MIKIEFWLKKLNTDQGNLEYIIVDTPKIDKSEKLGRENFYISEVYLSTSKVKKHPIYGVNPVNTLWLASEFAKTYLQALARQGYTISEVESKEPWKLEKLSDDYLQEGIINRIKNDKNISFEGRQRIFEILKETFAKSVIGDQLKEAIDKENK